MKYQDLLFLAILLFLLYKRKPEWFVFSAIVCLIAAIPLFSFWIFFTAQRLVLYGFILLVLGVLFALKKR